MIGKGRYFDAITRLSDLVNDPNKSIDQILDGAAIIEEKYRKAIKYNESIKLGMER